MLTGPFSSRLRRSGVIALLGAGVSLGALDVSAQPPPPSPGSRSTTRSAPAAKREPSSADVRVANDLYKAGLDRVKDAEWEAARDAFARAYELYPQPVILANLAGAEVRSGRVVAGIEHYRQLLKQPTGMSASEIELVTRAMKDAEARLAHVHITVTNSKPSDRIELDGTPLTGAALDIDYPVDPGKHVITALRAGSETARAEVNMSAGESRPVRLSPRLLATSPIPSAPVVEGEKPKLTSSPWFWIVTGALVVGAAAATVCLAAVCRDDEGFQGNLGSVKLP